MVLDEDGFVTRAESDRRMDNRIALGTDPGHAYTIAREDRRKTTSSRGLAIWNKCVYGSRPGMVGIDEAITLYTAHLYCRLSKPTPEKMDEIVRSTLARVQEVKDRDAPDERWDWDEEARNIRRKLDRWVVKWNGLKAEEKRR